MYAFLYSGLPLAGTFGRGLGADFFGAGILDDSEVAKQNDDEKDEQDGVQHQP